jgi:hypothetical protein
MSLLALSGTNSVSGGYDIDNSCKFESDNNEHLHRTPSSAGNTKTWTYSVWFKRTELGLSAQLISALDTYMYFETNDQAWLNFRSGGENFFLATNRVFRDTSAWYHAVIVCDVTDSTAADRAKLYINGVRETSYANSTYQNLDSNDTTGINATTVHRVGAYSNFGAYFNGYMAEAHLIDGQALDPTYFGEFDEDSGIWKPKEYTGTYGTNGFYLDFSDAANLGDDASGNGNNFTEASITTANAAVDSPTNNFAILSHAMQGYYEDQWSIISDGGTKFRCTEFDAWITTVSSIGVTKGKWYAEFQPTGARPNNMFGIASMEQLDNNSGYIYGGHLGKANESWGIGYYQTNGRLYKVQNSGSSNILNFGSGISQNQKVGVAIDMDNHNLYISISNTWQNSGDPTSGATGTGAISFDDTETVAFGLSGYSLGSGNDTIVSVNFGGYRTGGMPSINSTDANGYGVFRYAPPTGYYALCSRNLSEFG